MANEITASVALTFTDSARSINTDDMGLLGKSIDVTGTDFHRQSQTIGLTPEAIALGDVGTAGYVVMVNRETYNGSNYVTIRNGSSGADVIQLFGGDFAIFRAAVAATLYGDATGATQELDILIIEA